MTEENENNEASKDPNELNGWPETQSTDPNAPGYWPTEEFEGRKIVESCLGDIEGTKHDIGEYVECSRCSGKFQLRKYYLGVEYENMESFSDAVYVTYNETDDGDETVFVCYECAKKWYEAGHIHDDWMRLLVMKV